MHGLVDKKKPFFFSDFFFLGASCDEAASAVMAMAPSAVMATTLNSQSCTALPCNDRIKGWQSNQCLKFTANNAAATRKDTNTCATDVATESRFRTTATAPAATCPSLACVDATKCVPGAVSTSHDSIAEVCLANGASCGTGLQCQAGDCLKSPGQGCSANSECSTNICAGAATKCCNTACSSPCFDCAVSGLPAGQCAGTCSTAAGCGNAACPAVLCQNKVKGWGGMNSRTCEFYTTNTPSGVCTSRNDGALTFPAQGACAATSNLNYCLGATLDTTSFVCANAACRKTTTCQNGAAKPTVLGDVCFVAFETGACTGGDVCDATGQCKQAFGTT